MAVGKMKKLSVISMQADADSLMTELQRLRCVDLSASTTQLGETMHTPARDAALAAEIAKVSERLRNARLVIDFLSQYHKKTRSLFAPVHEVDMEGDTRQNAETEATLSLALGIEEKLRRVKNDMQTLENDRLSLLPWAAYTGVLPQSKTNFTETICGILSGGMDVAVLDRALTSYACITAVVSGNKTTGYAIAITMHTEDRDAVLHTLGSLGFSQTTASATAIEGFAAGKLSLIQSEHRRLTEEIVSLQHDAELLSEKLPAIEVWYDRQSTILARLNASGQLHYTDATVILHGWVPEKMTKKLVSLLEKRGDAYELTDPEPDDDVPVLLENNAMATQFEPVISLYSLPAYGTFDPTFIMSFFYIIIFGLMFADVGYGILLVAACLAGLKLMHPTDSLRKFLYMFAMCGGCMTVMGVFFGGYFGDLPDAISRYFLGNPDGCDLALWFNPLSEPMLFLFVSLGIGALHLFAGLCVKFYVLWKDGKRFSAVFDAGGWMLVFLGAGIAFLTMKVGIVIACSGLALLVLTQGRHEKNPVMKVLKGLLSLYDIVSYVSDLLSYSRILSLGLASAVIASVFNTIGTMFGPSAFGIIMLIIIGGIGHVMNLGINLLGSFVHTSRLQYIEFFGKFYEDGGKPFTPLSPESKYVRFQ